MTGKETTIKPILTLLTALLLAPLAALQTAETHKPNIIVIFTDDQGWADLGVQGVDAQLRTPKVDQLARDGVRLSRGYVTAPQCTPSRAGLLSGQYQNKLGVEQKSVRDMGQEKNNLIFHLGDNGAPLGKKGDGWINLPMRGQKGMLSEGGIRVPFVAAWSGKIPGGHVFEHPVISLDITATAIASAGQPPAPELDGVNLLPRLTGQKKNETRKAKIRQKGYQTS